MSNVVAGQESAWYASLLREGMVLAGRFLVWQLHRRMRHARAINERALWRIIEKNQHTEFGRQHHFNQLLPTPRRLAAYREAVPLSQYQDYAAAIERMAKGESNILLSEPVRAFSHTSGTTGPSKLIPVTPTLQKPAMFAASLMSPAIARQQYARGAPCEKGICLMSYTNHVERTEAGIPVGTGTALGMRRMTAWIPHMWCSPPEAFWQEDPVTARYLHALYGLRYRDTQYISAIYLPHALVWLNLLKERWEELLADIEAGTLSARLALPLPVRHSLQATLRPDPARAAELRALAARGFDGIVPQIWPRMAYVHTVATGTFAAQIPAARAYLGTVPIFSDFYGASEGAYGFNLWPEQMGDYALLVGYAHFEFIPLAAVAETNPATVGLDALNVGEAYELVITNGAGLYRYRTGDVVTIKRYYHETPVLNFEYRQQVMLNLVGEKVSEAHTHAAVTELLDTWLPGDQAQLRDYTTVADAGQVPPRYIFYLELMAEEVTQRQATTTLGQGARCLDRALGHAGLYAYCREKELLGGAQIKLLSPGSFDALYDILPRGQRCDRNRLKIPRCLIHAQQRELLEARVVAAS